MSNLHLSQINPPTKKDYELNSENKPNIQHINSIDRKYKGMVQDENFLEDKNLFDDEENVMLICDLLYETRTYRHDEETFSLFKIIKEFFNSCCKKKKAKQIKKNIIEDFYKNKSKILQEIAKINSEQNEKKTKKENLYSNFLLIDKKHSRWQKNLESLHLIFYFLNSVNNEELLCWINRFFKMFTKNDNMFMNDQQFRNLIDYSDAKIGVPRMQIILRRINQYDFANWTNFDRLQQDELTKATSCGPFTFQAMFSLIKHNSLRKVYDEFNIKEQPKLEAVVDYEKFFPYLFVIYLEICFSKIDEYKEKFCIVLGTDSDGEPLNENSGSLYDIFSTDLNYLWLDQTIPFKSIQNGILKYCLINREHITQEQTNLLISEIQDTILCDKNLCRHNIYESLIYNNTENDSNFENESEISFSLLKILKWIALRLCIIMNLNVQSITSKTFSADYAKIDNILKDLHNKKTETLKYNQTKLVEECILWYCATSEYFDRIILKKNWDKFVKNYSDTNPKHQKQMDQHAAKETTKDLIHDFLQESLPFIPEDSCTRFFQQYDMVKY